MSDQVYADVMRHAEGAQPTAAELDRMRARVLSALEDDGRDRPDIELLPPYPPDHGGTAMPSKRIVGILAAAAAAVLVVLGVVALGGGSGDEEEIIETTTPTPAPTETPVTEPTPTPTAPPTPTPDPEPTPADDTQSAPPGTVLLEDITEVPIRVDPGTYWLPTLGTELVLDIGERWTAHRHTAGRLVLGDAFTQGPGDNDLLFMRATELADPTRPTRVGTDWFYWPADDIDAWIDAVVPGVEISNVRETEVGGYPATTFDVMVDPDQLECISMGCIRFATNGDTFALVGLADMYRIWYVEQGVHEPVVIVASVSRSNDVWLAAVDEIVAGAELGEARPMPPVG